MYNITNQLLVALMKGLRPILILMGINAISSNWVRFSHLVCTFHRQYGRLDVVIRPANSDMKANYRRKAMQILCPHTTPYGSFSVYSSSDFTSFEKGHQSAALDI